jgi:hypothetical protein
LYNCGVIDLWRYQNIQNVTEMLPCPIPVSIIFLPVRQKSMIIAACIYPGKHFGTLHKYFTSAKRGHVQYLYTFSVVFFLKHN